MSKNSPLISVIIPVYNNAESLPDCLNSIINQTYQNLEIMVVNDGSTDYSSKEIDRFAKKDIRIKTILQKNRGLSAARNTGLKNASGKYVTFVDSDDMIEPNMIEKLLSALEKTNSDISVCSFKEHTANGKEKHFNKNNYSQKVLNTEQALRAMLKEQGFMLSATMKLYPLNFFKNVSFPVGKLHEDVGTTYRLFLKAKQIVFIPDELYIYVHHKDSIISQTFNDHKFDLIILTDQMCNDIDGIFPNLKKVTNERRIRARFSILRQIPLHHPKTRSIINYLKSHQDYINNNPEATTADRIALHLALLNPNLFKLAYKLKTKI